MRLPIPPLQRRSYFSGDIITVQVSGGEQFLSVLNISPIYPTSRRAAVTTVISEVFFQLDSPGER